MPTVQLTNSALHTHPSPAAVDELCATSPRPVCALCREAGRTNFANGNCPDPTTTLKILCDGAWLWRAGKTLPSTALAMTCPRQQAGQPACAVLLQHAGAQHTVAHQALAPLLPAELPFTPQCANLTAMCDLPNVPDVLVSTCAVSRHAGTLCPPWACDTLYAHSTVTAAQGLQGIGTVPAYSFPACVPRIQAVCRLWLHWALRPRGAALTSHPSPPFCAAGLPQRHHVLKLRHPTLPCNTPAPHGRRESPASMLRRVCDSAGTATKFQNDRAWPSSSPSGTEAGRRRK